MHDWITVREAAQILGVHMSAIPKIVRRGDLNRRSQRPVLNRDEVLVLRATREAAAAVKAAARQDHGPTIPRPPDDEHEWLSTAEAGALMGISGAGVSIRARRGRLPSVLHQGRRWFRRDHLELVRRADQAKRERRASAAG
jgi:hypothetical protein